MFVSAKHGYGSCIMLCKIILLYYTLLQNYATETVKLYVICNNIFRGINSDLRTPYLVFVIKWINDNMKCILQMIVEKEIHFTFTIQLPIMQLQNDSLITCTLLNTSYVLYMYVSIALIQDYSLNIPICEMTVIILILIFYYQSESFNCEFVKFKTWLREKEIVNS